MISTDFDEGTTIIIGWDGTTSKGSVDESTSWAVIVKEGDGEAVSISEMRVRS